MGLGVHTCISCWPTSLLKAISASLTRLLTVSFTMNLSSAGVGNPLPVSGVLGGPRLTFLAAREANANSFMRKVGVPSMHECSPMKPDLPFSNTITEGRSAFARESKKEAHTLMFIIESVLAVANPTGPRSLFTSNGLRVIKTDKDHGGLDSLK